MKSAHRVGLLMLLFTLVGLALFVILFAQHGIADVAQALARAGWGLAAVIAFHVITLFLDSLSWRALLPAAGRPSVGRLFFIHWIGDAVSAMLPVAQVGGEVVRVRLVAARGVALPAAASSVLIGMTLSVATQILFTLSGLVVLVFLADSSFDGAIVRTTIIASFVGILCVAGFYLVQRVGIFRIVMRIISHIASDKAWEGLRNHGSDFDRELHAAYARRAALVESSLWTMATWAAGAVEVWIALSALGIHASYGHAYVLESVSQGIRSAFFLVPGAVGFQEGGYVSVGRLLGISAINALALSLVHRAREIAFGIPGLVAWQWAEGRRLWRRPAAREALSQSP